MVSKLTFVHKLNLLGREISKDLKLKVCFFCLLDIYCQKDFGDSFFFFRFAFL